MSAQIASYEPSGLYWTPASKVDASDIIDALSGVIAGRSDHRAFTFFQASAFDIPSAAPAGLFEVAVSRTGQACGVFCWFDDMQVRAVGPIWTSFTSGNPEDAVANVYKALIDADLL